MRLRHIMSLLNTDTLQLEYLVKSDVKHPTVSTLFEGYSNYVVLAVGCLRIFILYVVIVEQLIHCSVFNYFIAKKSPTRHQK